MPDDQSAPPRGEPARTAAPLGPEPRAPTAPAAAPPAARRNRSRARLFAILAVVIIVAAVGWGAYWVMIASNYVSTDDAYVNADVAAITPQISGQVAEVRVQDTQPVKRGDVLVVIDPADERLAVANAEAEYGRAIRRVRQYLANNQAATAEIAARGADFARAQAQVVAAQSDVERTRIDLKRREALSGSGAVSGEELTTAKNAFQTAEANLTAAKAALTQAEASRAVAEGQLQSGLALTQGVEVDQNPEVAAARAQLDTARLNLSRAVIRAPVDGVVAQRQVQVGQRVAIGAQLMTVVPVTQVYVDANFKEVQLRKVEIGQPATLTADRYGHGVVFHGRVQGVSGGTGSAFAVIPAQNATGNWIKVVQRLPIRISLDPAELQHHPLRVGLSMDVKIDVSQRGQASVDQPQATSPSEGQTQTRTQTVTRTQSQPAR